MHSQTQIWSKAAVNSTERGLFPTTVSMRWPSAAILLGEVKSISDFSSFQFFTIILSRARARVSAIIRKS
jgi:hypothetical protein